MSKFFVPPTVAAVTKTDKLPHIKTWTERLRLVCGETQEFMVCLFPKGTYAQLTFMGGTLAGITSESELNDFKEIGASIATGIVEGYVTSRNDFVALRILTLEGVPTYSSWEENFTKLQASGFTTASYRIVKGYYDLTARVLNWQGCNNTYIYAGVLCLVNDVTLEAELTHSKHLPDPGVTYVYWDENIVGAAQEDSSAENVTSKETKIRSVDFFGKLPEKHAVYKQMAIDVGIEISISDPEVVVVFDTTKIPSKIRSLKNPPKVIDVSAFLEIIDQYSNGDKEDSKEESSNEEGSA